MLDGRDEDGNLSDNSDDFWILDSFVNDLVLNVVVIDDGEGKRYVCLVFGCGKWYKNVNGIKYYVKYGYRKDLSWLKKVYKCYCGKSYKSLSGFWYYMVM